MLIKNNSKVRKVKYSLVNLLSLIIFTTMEIWAQMPTVPVSVPEIAESEEDGRMIQAARAAIEGDLVERSLVRLVHEDKKAAFEAFALVALLIKAGETQVVFNALENH